jgi:FtsP/CotA-like multicopper oxidase with cupredoxin domain
MRVRRWAIGGLSAAGAVLVASAAAWACVSGPSINLSTINAKPGQEVTLTGTNWTKPDPVQVRWNSLDGPIVATLDKPTSGAIQGTFNVPADAKAGNYVLIVSQTSADGKLSQMPVRALLTVTPDGGATPVVGGAVAAQQTGRPTGLVTNDSSISGASLALIGLGVAGVGMFVAGMAALFAGRRGRAPEAVRARS